MADLDLEALEELMKVITYSILNDTSKKKEQNKIQNQEEARRTEEYLLIEVGIEIRAIEEIERSAPDLGKRNLTSIGVTADLVLMKETEDTKEDLAREEEITLS